MLWDKRLGTIVNNESGDILRMLNSEFNAFAMNPSLDLYPPDLAEKLEEAEGWLHDCVTDGVYMLQWVRCVRRCLVMIDHSRPSISQTTTRRVPLRARTDAAGVRRGRRRAVPRPGWVEMEGWLYRVDHVVLCCPLAYPLFDESHSFITHVQCADHAEAVLGRQRYLLGDRLTGPDLRLFHALVRFDEVYLVRVWLHLRGCTGLRLIGCNA